MALHGRVFVSHSWIFNVQKGRHGSSEGRLQYESWGKEEEGQAELKMPVLTNVARREGVDIYSAVKNYPRRGKEH